MALVTIKIHEIKKNCVLNCSNHQTTMIQPNLEIVTRYDFMLTYIIMYKSTIN